ncbi:MAG: hypothetical protein HUJ56_10360, partial [Erysipelotrichaceae bacterium]|nr:hypothetical protein [Erysipelotrichaceae bacterium]
MVSNKQNPSSATYTASETQKGWDDLLNICYDENKIAKCDNLTSKRGAKTTPAPITMKQFDFNLPTDASISLVKLRYRDRIKGITEVLPEIEAPTITIKYGDGLTHTVTGKKPDNNMNTHELNVINLGLTGEQINSPDFSVVLSYPNNTGEYGGSVYVQFFEVEVEYDTPKYNVSFTEPRHSNDWVSWSTEDDPSHFALYAPQELTSYFRTINGVNVTMQEVIYHIPKSFQVRSVECPYGSYEWIDETHLKWSVVAPLTKGYNKYNYIYKPAWIKFKLFPIANEKTELITATNKYCNATYYADIYDQFDTLMRNNDLTVSHSNFERYRDGDTFWYLVDIDSIPVSELEKMDYKIRIQTKIYNDDTDEYIDQMCHFTMASDSNRNYKIDSQWYSNDTSVVIVDASFLRGSGNNKIQFLMNGLFHDQYAYDRFMGVEGNYEFHISLFYEEDVSEPVLFKYPFYVEPAPVYNFELVHQDLVVGTPNIATRTGAGGCTFLCETQEGFGRWNSNMSGFKSFIENRYRHIGALKVDHSHYEPKYTFKNPVKEGSWKERKYFSKSGKWEDSLSLNIYLPFLDWKTLEGFVKMDKPVAIELCPTCPDEDVLNHRGWVELEDITNVERTNPWLYKGDIGVRYLTRKYWARATIIKGNRIINSEVPYTLINVLEKDDYFLDWFELLGAGQVVYDLDKNIVNEINCGTGESLHFRNRWVLKDINDYTFCWTSTLPSQQTDMSNDYQYNSITFSILDARDKTILLQYILYDFRTYSDTGEIINTCNANCT